MNTTGFKIVDLPEAGREAQHRRWGIRKHSRRTGWSGLGLGRPRRRWAPDTGAGAFTALAEDHDEVHSPRAEGDDTKPTPEPTDDEAMATGRAAAFFAEKVGGRHVIHTKSGAGGLRGHRGPLTIDERAFLDTVRFNALLEQELGFSFRQVNRAFPPRSRGGRPPKAVAALRHRIEDRLLQVEEAGGSMVEIGQALGWAVQDSGNGRWCERMSDALKRARGRRQKPPGVEHHG